MRFEAKAQHSWTVRRVGFILLAIVFLGIAGLAGVWLWLFPPVAALRATVQERITGETPHAKIRAYVRAVVRGDETAALASWELPTWELPDGQSSALSERRRAVTRELMVAGVTADFLVLGTQWWRTCCEPGVINNPRDAGGARVSIQFLDRNGSPLIYVFDLFTRGGPYWGGAMGYPPRRWALRDVYPSSQEPLFWRWLYEPHTRYLDWSPSPAPSAQ